MLDTDPAGKARIVGGQVDTGVNEAQWRVIDEMDRDSECITTKSTNDWQWRLWSPRTKGREQMISRTRRQMTLWGTLALAGWFVAACVPNPPPPGNSANENVNDGGGPTNENINDDGGSTNENVNDNSDPTNENVNSRPPDCGNRTVRSIPDPGQYELIFESNPQEIEGSGGLADYFTLSNADCVGEDIEIPPEILTVGANGVIEEGASAGAAFIVSDGCLIEDSPSGEPEDPNEPCGKDAFPIGSVVPDGLFPGDMGDSQSPFGSDFVCVTFKVENVCLDCSQNDSGWITEEAFKIVYTAQGSISLPFFDPCTGEMITIDVIEGETAKTTVSSTTTVRPSE